MTQEYYDHAPETLTIRELRVNGKILITTLLSPKSTSKAELKALYKKRWDVEVDFRHLKTTLGMDTLSCKSPEMINKEIWTYFLAYNLVRLLMVQAALMVDILPQTLSFKHTLQLWLTSQLQRALLGYRSHELLALIAQRRVGNRPGRLEPRAIKRRPKPFPLLMRPRAEARLEVMKNGHPKKLK